MHFTSEEKLKGFLDAASVDALLTGIPAGQHEKAITYVDSIITGKTGIAPAATNHDMLEGIAAHLVIWHLSGQNPVGEEEMRRREKAADDAMALLDQIRDGDITLTPPSSTIDPVFAAAPRRVEDY